MTTFAELKMGATFYDVFISEQHTKIEPMPIAIDKRRGCKRCNTPTSTYLNAKASDGSLVHFCPTEEVLTERAKVEA